MPSLRWLKSQLSEEPSKYVGSYLTEVQNYDLGEMVKATRQAQPDLVVITMRGGNLTNFIETARSAEPPIDCKFLYLNQLEGLETFIDPILKTGDWQLGSEMQPEFEERFRNRFGQRRVVTDEMISAYNAVKLWANAVEQAETTEADVVFKTIPEVKGGQLQIDAESLNAWHSLAIDEFQPDGRKKNIMTTKMLQPVMYPSTRSPRDWDLLLRQKYYEWEKHWRKPQP